MIHRLIKDEAGATSIEYGLICAMIFLAIVTAIGYYTDRTAAMYDRIGSAIASTAR